MGLSFWHILVVVAVVLVVFGRGRIPNVMGDFGKGLRSFKDGLDGKSETSEMPKPESPKKVADQSDTTKH